MHDDTNTGLIEQRDAKLARVNELAAKDVDTEGAGMTEDEAREFDTLEAEVRELNARVERFNRVAGIDTPALRQVLGTQPNEPGTTPPATPGAPKVSEPALYRKGGQHSFFKDARDWQVDGSSEARERITGYQKAHAAEYEARALTSTDANGGYLVPPLWAMDEFVELRAKAAVAASLVRNLPLPGGTDSINLPTMDGATATALATENSALQETSATFSKVTASVYRIGGQQKIPNTLIDRGVAGAMIDQIVLADLAKRLAIQVDGYVLDGAGSTVPLGMYGVTGIGSDTYTAATATPAGLHAKLVSAITKVATGCFEFPDAIVMHPRRWGWLLGQADATAYRTFVSEIGQQNQVATTVHAAQGYAGTYSGVPVYLDANIDITDGAGTDEDYILVFKRDEQYLFNGVPKFEVSRDAAFSSDQTVVRAVQDVAFTAERLPGSIARVVGTGLNDTL